MKKKKKNPKRFCKVCSRRVIFNRDKFGFLVCSRCGTKSEEKEIKKNKTTTPWLNAFIRDFLPNERFK